MCINLFTNSVGPIILVLYFQNILNLDYIYVTLNILYMIQKNVILLCISKVMVPYIFNTNFK